MKNQKTDVLFQLSGQSREQAIYLHNFLENKIDRTPGSVKKAYEALGVKYPVIRIKHYFEGLPRAYEAFPMVCLHPFKEDEFYMIAPIGYNGAHFTPEDAVLIDDEKKIDIIMKGLFAEGWTDPAYLILPRDKGVETPSDYDPVHSLHYTTNSGLHTPDRPYAFFKPKSKDTVISLVDDNDTVTEMFTNATGGKIEAFLKKPAAQEDWIDKLINNDMLRPIIRNFPCGPTLAYRCDDPEKFVFCPEGFDRISPAEFQWLDADQNDAMLGISPPPSPFAKKQEPPEQNLEDRSCSPS